MTFPPQDHPQHELKRRIADCRERLRRTRPGQKTSTHDAPAGIAAHDEATSDAADEAHTRPRRPALRRASRR